MCPGHLSAIFRFSGLRGLVAFVVQVHELQAFCSKFANGIRAKVILLFLARMGCHRILGPIFTAQREPKV